ncbi:hypothetical protein C6P45_001170 [Maudiozyma exigua]|uniref:RNB domain-containing protein n=1 Tax=Maudiozyma exigua TaxID=34358 RepID=A0A9P6WG48_MAUEX|nr:hypothetical protein C6P45_001170 [Kazachstania exigua]
MLLRFIRIRSLHSSTTICRGKSAYKKGSTLTNNNIPKPKTLTANEIKNINKQFLERTNGLEPEFEIKELVDIQEEYKERYLERYIEPSRKWYQYEWTNESKPKLFSSLYINGRKELDPTLFPKQTTSFQVTDLMKNTLTIGDMVLLGNATSNLAMCVALPESTADPRYTFISIDGELIFEDKYAVSLRIPYALPEEVHRLVKRESKHTYEPIGKVKNSRDETFMTPLLANQLITNALPSRISSEAWDKLPIVVKKLKLLHRHLNEPRGAIQISFVQLCQMVDSINLDHIEPEEIKLIIKHVTDNPSDTVNNATFLAVYLGIKEQQIYNLWGKIYRNSALLSPMSVTVLPLKSQHFYYSEIINQMRQKNFKEVNKFISFFNNNEYSRIEKELPHYLNLLRDYAAGNFQNNPQIVAFISKIFRKIGKYKDSDISRDISQELLETIQPQEKSINPLHYNNDLALPISSHLAKDRKLVYDIVEPSISDNHSDIRKDYTDLPVYCIDSEDAHEIDDGISIRKLGSEKFEILVHIADPASFFPECHDETIENDIKDEILGIAYDKSFTSYLPDNVDPMLPKSFSKAADLGIDGRKSKTITFSCHIIFNKNEHRLEVLKETFNVSLSYASKFPKATYKDIDNVLSRIKDATPEMLEDVTTLYAISESLRKYRIHKHNAIIFGSGFNKGLPKLMPDKSDETKFEIKLEDQKETSSTILVSEFMILANSLCGEYFKKNGIPGVFRCYSNLELSIRANNQYHLINDKVKRGRFPGLRDLSRVASFLNSSFYSAIPMAHAMIGASQYLTVTSPLRRLPDLINHLQLHRHLSGKNPLFTQDKIKDMIWKMQSRADITKTIAHSVNTYWTLKHLRQILNAEKNKTFDVCVLSVPIDGTVKCVMKDYSFSRGTLKLNKDSIPPVIGDTIEGCKITNILPIEGILTFEV